jgi:hypothetical protein
MSEFASRTSIHISIYLDASREVPDANEVTSAAPATATKKQHLFDFSPAPSFDHTWPAKKGAVKTTEHFTNAREGVVPDGGRVRHVKIGFTLRHSAGKRRLRCLILVDRYPTVEFVAADEKAKGTIGATLPPEYTNLATGSYNGVVQGPRASNGVAVLCDSEDFVTMVRHALIRYKFREGRASARNGPEVSRG